MNIYNFIIIFAKKRELLLIYRWTNVLFLFAIVKRFAIYFL